MGNNFLIWILVLCMFYKGKKLWTTCLFSIVLHIDDVQDRNVDVKVMQMKKLGLTVGHIKSMLGLVNVKTNVKNLDKS